MLLKHCIFTKWCSCVDVALMSTYHMILDVNRKLEKTHTDEARGEHSNFTKTTAKIQGLLLVIMLIFNPPCCS